MPTPAAAQNAAPPDAFVVGMMQTPGTTPLELEVKFRLPADADARLAAHPALQAAGSSQVRHDVTTYYDTPSWTLARAGISLRVRRRGDRHIQTLKLPGAAPGGAFARQEWEWPVASDAPDLHCLHDSPLAPRVAELDGLHPVYVTDIHRRVQTLRHDGATIELSFDHGHVRAGAAREAIDELELELEDGDPAALYRLAAALHADLPLTIGTESKGERGWRLCTGQPRGAVKQEKLDLPPEATAAEAFRRIVGTVLAHLLANQPAAEAGDMEGVHQMRVAIRRLRSALVLFRPLLEPRASARFTGELRRLGHVFGEARDWDVFVVETLPAARHDGVAPGWIDLLCSEAQRKREAAHEQVRAELRGPALTALTLGLAAWAGDPASLAGDPDGAGMRVALRGVAPALVGRLAGKVRRRGGHLRRRSQTELHALRKSLKKLRYGVDFLAPLGKKRRVKAYLQGCKALQERLGAMNDAAVAVALAEQLGGDRQAELAPAVAALAGWANVRQDAARVRFRKDWRRFGKVSERF